MKKILFWLVILSSTIISYTQATIYHVRTTGTMVADGLTWATSTTLQNALTLSVAGDTILVAQGTYKPGATTASTFLMKNNLLIRGGYSNTGSPAFNSRNVTGNITILSGDVNGNDNCAAMISAGTTATFADNTFHVVTIPATVTKITIDGFTISGGFAGGAGVNAKGGGMFISLGAGQIILQNMTFSCNAATNIGGAIMHSSTSLTVTSSYFDKNRSTTNDGGAIYGEGDSLRVTSTNFTNNKGSNGAAVYVNLVTPANCVYTFSADSFKTNTANNSGGAINIQNGKSTGTQISDSYFEANTALRGGAVAYFLATDVTGSVFRTKFMGNTATGVSGGAIAINATSIDGGYYNNVFSNNSATANTGTNGAGGAIAIEGLTATQLAPAIYNNTFSRNSAASTNLTKGGGALFVDNCNAAVVFNVFNNILWNNIANTAANGNNLRVVNSTSFIISNSIMNAAETSCTGACEGTNMTTLYNKDPQFYDDNGLDNVLGNRDDDLRLKYDATAVKVNNAFDLGVTSNIVSGNTINSPSGDIISAVRTCKPDLGAYEYLHIWAGTTSAEWNTAGNWSPRSGAVVPDKTMNVWIGANNWNDLISTTNPAVPLTPVLTATNYTGFSMYVGNSFLMNTNSIITLQGNLYITGNAKFNDSANPYGGKVIMKPTDCTFPQIISHSGSQLNFYHLEIDNVSGVTKTGNNATVKLVTELTNGNLAVNGGFTLLSTATQTAMVANDPAAGVSPTTRRITGNVTVQRHITGHPSYTGMGYRYFSSPVDNYSYSQFTQTPLVTGAGYYWYNYAYTSANFPTLFIYQEGNNTDDGTNTGGFEGGSATGGWRCPTASPATGQGFNVHTPTNITTSFRGTVNNGTLTIPVTKTGASTYSGWNLVGNPYPSPLDWDAVVAANAAVVEAALYRRIAKGTLNVVSWGKYIAGVGTIEGGTVGGNTPDNTNITKDIALGQGFFVVAKTNGNITLTNAMRPTVATQTNPLFLRSENDKPMALKLRCQNSQFYDEMIVHFKEKATENYDGDFDAHKAPENGGTMPDMYMISADKKNISINGLPFSALQKNIPFVVKSKIAGEYQIKVQDATSVPTGSNIFLWDKELNIKQNLLLNPVYKFNAKVATYNTRFELIFDVSISANLVGNLTVYPNPSTDNKVTLRLLTNGNANLDIAIYDAMGRLAKTLTANKDLNTFEMPLDLSDLSQGVYMIYVSDEKGKYVTKFVK